VTRRSLWLGTASLAIGLAFVPQAAAKLAPEAKFKVQSVSGREALSFQEDGQTSTGTRCVGTTSSEVTWRSTRPATVYVFVKRVSAFHRKATILSADRVGQSFESVPVAGKATVARSVSYTETAGCEEEPTNCPETTAPAKPFLTGTAEPSGSVNGGLDIIHLPPGVDRSSGDAGPIAAGIVGPFGNAAGFALPSPTVSAFAIPRSRLLDRKRERLKDSVTVKEPLSGTYDAADQATASGTYTDHLAIKLKRLKLKR
jgi:hypothetical protein